MSEADLHIWEATNDPGTPTCINGGIGKGGLSLSLYQDENGAIIGGIVSDDAGIETAFGYIHSGEYLEEVKGDSV